MEKMPDRLRQRAAVTGSGELLWPAEAVAEAIRWIAGHGLGIHGFEVYVRRAGASGSFEREWSVEQDRRADEPWHEYVRRAADQALDALADDLRRGYADRADRRYFIAASSECG